MVVRPVRRALGRVRGRARLETDMAAARAALDRNYHWLVHVERGQQELASAVVELRQAVGRVEHAVGWLGGELGRQLGGLQQELDVLRHGVGVVAEQAAWIGAPEPRPNGPLVSVICPVYNRADVVGRALGSLRAQTHEWWECLVVDDGSDDIDHETLDGWQADERIRVIRQKRRQGAAAARNRGLAAAEGEIVAYLDSDNTWHPTYLARVVDTFAGDPDAVWTVASQLIQGGGTLGIRRDRHDVEQLAHGNFIDLNAVAHRRSLLSEVTGPDGFDESFARLSDWELVQRFAQAAGAPRRIPAVGSLYHEDRHDRISAQVPLHPHLERLRARGRGRPADGLRVLAAEWRYPQASEQYVRADVVGLAALGAHVEAWSEEDVAVGYESPVPVHRGELAAAIVATRPDVVLTHRLQIGQAYLDTVREAGIALAVRCPGLDDDPERLERLLTEPGVMMHLFPHIEAARGLPHPRVRPLPVSFDQDRYPPTPDKERRMVVRTGVALRSKDYDCFFEAAKRCPEHRFVLVLCTPHKAEEQLDEIVVRCEELAAPVEIVMNPPPEKAAELVRQAGVYLHTHGDHHTYGMSGSIAEALGTGCYVLARDLPGMAGFLADAGALYRDADHAAALIQETVHWNADRWQRVWHHAADHAHLHFGAADVAAAMVTQWREVLGVPATEVRNGITL